ncbi:hypothetical protein [Flavobacterium sp.]|uniref:hypothetical protein n=1 Tax=Flavobacterium sp. TaxID=239 RepID=UPI002B4B55CE|nr:hypothetical protein [Flavobacterium sp.]HLF51510.1 hypothetical protein [Flavobacterium sp.]
MALQETTLKNGGSFGTFSRGGVELTPKTGGIAPTDIPTPVENVPDTSVKTGTVKTEPEQSPNVLPTGNCQLCGLVQDWIKKNPMLALLAGFLIVKILLK